MFFNSFGPASDPYLRAACTPALPRVAADATLLQAPANESANKSPGGPRRRRLAALSLAAALAAPLVLGMTAGASAQQVEEPGQDAAKDAAAAPVPTQAPAPDAAETATVGSVLAGRGVAPGEREAANEKLVRDGMAQLARNDFEAAEETLGKVRTVNLSTEQRKKVIEARTQAERGTDERRTARAQFEMGEQALAAGRVTEATQYFRTVANNRYADGDLRRTADEKMAVAAAAVNAQGAGKAATAPQYAAVTPEDSAAAAPAKPLTAKQHYAAGKDALRKNDLASARQHFQAARDAGYHAAMFEDSPAKMLKRIDEREAQQAKAASKGKAGKVVMAAQANQPNGNAEGGQGAGDPNLQEDLRSTAIMQDVRRRQDIAEARRLTAEGRQAQQQNDLATARDRYQRAVQLDPGNTEAAQGLDEVLRLRGEVPGGAQGTALTRAQAAIEAARQEISYRFDDAVRRAQRAAVRISNLDVPFNENDLLEGRRALEEAAVARNSNPTIFREDELSQFDTRLADARVTLNQAEERRQRFIVERQRGEELDRFEAAQREARAQRERTIADLIRTSRELSSRHQYEEALALIDQILELDPRNDYAIGVRPLIQDALHFAEQRKWRERFDQEWADTFNAAEEKKIPYHDVLNYPSDWPDISALRDRTVAQERGQTEGDAAVMAQLNKTLPELNFDGVAFNDVVDFFRDVTGANVFVNWKALEAAGVDKTTPVNAKVRNIRFSKALTLVLDSLGSTVPLGYTIDEGVITISSGEDLDKNTMTRVYDIRDLIVDVPDFTNAPTFSLQSTTEQAQSSGGGGGGGGGGSGRGLFENTDNNREEQDVGRTRQEMIEEITRLIMDTVSTDSWRDNGGTTGSIRELQGQLIVTQTPENQRQLVALLEQLRETRAIQVTIEARFLTVSRNFMEDIGIDADFAFNVRNNGRRTWSPVVVNQDNSFTQTPSTGVPGSIAATLDSFTPALTTGVTYLDDFQVNLLLRATQASRNASIVTAPRVTLFNGQRAYVLVATQRAYVSDLNAQVGTGVGIFDPTISTVQSGVLLDVQATVSADRKYVTMTLRPQLADLLRLAEFVFQVGAAGTGTFDPNNPLGFVGSAGVPTGVIQQPELQITEVRTTVSVPDGGTLLLGGQTIAGEIEVEQGVPILSKIPFLKRLFTNRSRAKDEQVLLILVRPTIIIQREIENAQFPLLSNRAPAAGGGAGSGPAAGMRGLNQ